MVTISIEQTGCIQKSTNGACEGLIIPVRLVANNQELNEYLAPVKRLVSSRGGYWSLYDANAWISGQDQTGSQAAETFALQLQYFGKNIFHKAFEIMNSNFSLNGTERITINL